MTTDELILDTASKAFESEAEHFTILQEKAEKYIVAIGAITAFNFLNFDDLTSHGPWFAKAAAWGAFISLAISLVCVLVSMIPRSYEGYPRNNVLVETLSKPGVTTEEAVRALSRMYSKATEYNARLNDCKGRLLLGGSGTCIFGFILVVLSRIITRI